jgi:aldose 1-epimerase
VSPRRRSERLVLVGMMGAGKTTTAYALAERLAWPVRDCDVDLEARTGRTAAELAADPAADGLEGLHRLEEDLLIEALATEDPVIVAAAASTVGSARVRELLAGATVVWLDVPVDELLGRAATGAHRRALDRAAAAALYGSRSGHLAAVADLRLDGRAPIGTIVDAVLRFIGADERIVDFGRRRAGDRASLFSLGHARGVTAKVTDHGATLVELHVPDRDGTSGDVVLGFGSVAGYESDANAYFGATVGRVANRIARGTFELAGRRHELARNDPPNHLHGGAERSFDKVRWEVVDRSDDLITLRYVSPDGEEGYPGRVEVTATYRVTEDALVVEYRAETDAPTPVDLTNHAYLNLAGEGTGAVVDHELEVFADRYLLVDEDLVSTGELADVAGTPLDLRVSGPLGPRIHRLAGGPTCGLDHHYVLRGAAGRLRPVAWLHDPTSGRSLELSTDQPGLQVYTAGHLEPAVVGKHGHRYGRHDAICLEPHHPPGSLHHPQLPSIVLEPGRTYRHTTVYRFSASPHPTG